MAKNSKSKDEVGRPTISNRKARHEYQILETLECGIQLTGTEIKSIREGKIILGEAYIEVTEKFELYMVNAYIDEFTQGNRNNHDPRRRRKLLAHRSEILKFHKAKEVKGLTIVPLKLYFKGSYAKLEIGLAKGKDQGDKRQDLIKKTQQREMDRAMKSVRF